jgi:O-antigen ligase
MIVFWIIVNNGEYALKWALRSYVLGSLGTIAITILTGAAMESLEEGGQERYTATVGSTVNANFLAALMALAFLAAIYLLVIDRSLIWKGICIVAMVILPIMILKAGSRGVLVALLFTLMSPLLFIRQVAKRPVLALTLLATIIIVCGVTLVLFKSQGVSERVASRLTDTEYAQQSIATRMALNIAAIRAVLKYPLGTGFYTWFDRTNITHWPHSDFFFCLGVYGYPGVLLFCLIIIAIMIAVKRTPLGMDKLYARAVLTFSIVMGFDGTQIYEKDYWVFMAIILAMAELAQRKEVAASLSENTGNGTDFNEPLSDKAIEL